MSNNLKTNEQFEDFLRSIPATKGNSGNYEPFIVNMIMDNGQNSHFDKTAAQINERLLEYGFVPVVGQNPVIEEESVTYFSYTYISGYVHSEEEEEVYQYIVPAGHGTATFTATNLNDYPTLASQNNGGNL